MKRLERKKKSDGSIGRVKHLSERTCVGCKAKCIPRNLLRLACTPHGEVILDRSGRLPGRGAYVCFDAECLRKALRPAKLVSAFKRSVDVPAFEVLYRTAVALLYERLGTCLSMAQKAGAVISGYTPLHKALVHAEIVCMVLAKDIAPSRAEEYRFWCDQQDIPCVMLFTKVRLGSLIGRANRSAVGLTDPRFRELFCTTVASLEKLCSCDTPSEVTSECSSLSF